MKGILSLALVALVELAVAIPGDHHPPYGTGRVPKAPFPTGTGAGHPHPPFPTGTGHGHPPFPTGTGHGTGYGTGHGKPPLSTGHHGPHKPPVSVTTITETISRTIFVPCSTPVVSEKGHTYYSTWLTTSIWTTTTCYSVSQPLLPSPTSSPGCPGGPGCSETFPEPSPEPSPEPGTETEPTPSLPTSLDAFPGPSSSSPNCPLAATVTVTVTACGPWCNRKNGCRKIKNT